MDIFRKNLLQGKYADIEEKCKVMDRDSIRDMIMLTAYDTESICVYGFTRHMIEKTRDEYWIELAIDVLINPLCFIEGAYSVALFHARELLAVKRSIKNLDRILFFYNIPERLVDEEEASYIAEEILRIEPNNEIALEIRKGGRN